MDQAWIMGADLATTLLGEGRRSRLVSQLREELQIAETVDMDLSALELGSLITLEISCDPADLPQVEACVHEQLTTPMPFSPIELDRGRQLVGNGLRYALESSAQVASMSASQTLWGRPSGLAGDTFSALEFLVLGTWIPHYLCRYHSIQSRSNLAFGAPP